VGGFGSGRSGWGKRKADSCLAVDVRALRKLGYLHQPGALTGFELRAAAGNCLATCLVRIGDGYIRVAWGVRYRNGDKDREWQCKGCQVALVQTPCNFGGLRHWFICPNWQCGRRVTTVYIVDGEPGCRHCHKLAYACQAETAVGRAQGRQRKIRRRLGMGPNLSEPIVQKPKGMHWRTFRRLRDQANSYQAASLADMLRFIEQQRRIA
jgi:hypothetical protein